MGANPETACHELLLRLPGRLADRQLWRFRDWLAAGALDALAASLPLTLLRERIGLTLDELELLTAGLETSGAEPGLLNAVHGVDDVPPIECTFAPEPAAPVTMGDTTGMLLGAILRGRPGVRDVRVSWRSAPEQPTVRVLLAFADDGCPQLTGELQRVLRVLGDREPCVEVLPSGMDPTPYHRAALAASELICVGAAELVAS